MLAGLKWFETYVPKNLVLRLMRSGGTSVQSEEREVTVLFTDLVDFTQIGSRLAPAQLAALLNEHFTLLAEAIEAEEGTVDKYMGDSIMAFWGAPLDQPDHAARACRAARNIARRVSIENVRRRAAGEAPLGLRIGIHSGAAIVGNIGAPSRVNYTMIGDTVNIAQRLEGLGKEVSPDTEVAVLRYESHARCRLRGRGAWRVRPARPGGAAGGLPAEACGGRPAATVTEAARFHADSPALRRPSTSKALCSGSL